MIGSLTRFSPNRVTKTPRGQGDRVEGGIANRIERLVVNEQAAGDDDDRRNRYEGVELELGVPPVLRRAGPGLEVEGEGNAGYEHEEDHKI